MWINTLDSIGLEEFPEANVEGKWIDFWFYRRSETVGVTTTVELKHREYGANGIDYFYFPKISSAVKSLNQNCLYPGYGPVMVNAGEKGTSGRRVAEIAEIEGVDVPTGHVRTTKPFLWMPNVDDFREEPELSTLLKKIAFRKGTTTAELVQELNRRRRVLEWMAQHDVVSYEDVSSLINLYYKDPQRVLAWVAAGRHPDTIAKEAGAVSATGLRFLKEG